MTSLLIVALGTVVPVSVFAVQASQPQSGATAPRQQKTESSEKSQTPVEKGTSTFPQASKPSPSATSKKTEPRAWSVKVSSDTPQFITVKNAKDVRVADIVAEISRQIKIPIILSDLVKKERVSVDFELLPLDAAMRMFAPAGFIDYSLTGNYSVPPKPLAVYLSGFNERVTPEANTAVRQAIDNADVASKGKGRRAPYLAITGDTETPTINPALERSRELFESGQLEKLEEENPIKISYQDNKISVLVHQQPLTAVLHGIAGRVGIPADIYLLDDPSTLGPGDELVSIDVKDLPVEDAIRRLSPNVEVQVRTDLMTFTTSPIRVTLIPSKASTTPAAKNAASTSADTTKN